MIIKAVEVMSLLVILPQILFLLPKIIKCPMVCITRPNVVEIIAAYSIGKILIIIVVIFILKHIYPSCSGIKNNISQRFRINEFCR
jgi:hypothetical protein